MPKQEKSWRQERKEKGLDITIQCEFLGDTKSCNLLDLEFCRYDGNKKTCDIYRVENMRLTNQETQLQKFYRRFPRWLR